MPLKDGSINEILSFGVEGEIDAGDVLAQEDYAADVQRRRGHQVGLARRELANKQARQSAHMAAGLAQFIANRYGPGVLDDGDLDKIETGMQTVLDAMIARGLLGYALQSDLDAVDGSLSAHAKATAAHSATSAATGGRIMIRDAAGRAKVATPVAADDIATKGYADGAGTPMTRSISTTVPLTGGGNLSANRTLGLSVGAGLQVASNALAVKYGTAAATACQGNDARLADARTPKAHAHSTTDITSGTLAVARGGTGVTNIQDFVKALYTPGGSKAEFGYFLTFDASGAASGHTNPKQARNAMGLGNTLGALPVANGGTGQTTVQALRNSMGLGNTIGALPVANGGTGATTAAKARAALGVPYAQSLKASGWYQLPGGMIFQWVYAATGSLWTFPIAFPTACRLVIVTDASAGSLYTKARGETTTTDAVIHGLYDNKDVWTAFAIGY